MSVLPPMQHQGPRYKTGFSKDAEYKYVMAHSLRMHPAQEQLKEKTMKHKRAVMLSSPDEMQLLANLCKLISAKKTLEIGTYTGYSALSIALALPADGKVVCCDITDEFVNEIGRECWKMAGVEDKIDLRIAPAVETLEKLQASEAETFDFVFIDADKSNLLKYYEMSLKLLRPGGLLAIDNVLWEGKVIDETNQEDWTKRTRELNEHVAKDMSVDVSMLSVGDGTTLVFKRPKD